MKTSALVLALGALGSHAATPLVKAPAAKASGALTASAAPAPTASTPLVPKTIRNDMYACIPASNPQGMDWKDGRWQPTTFKEIPRFTLQVTVIEVGEKTFLHFTRKSSAGDDHCGTLYNPFAFDGADSCTSVGATTVFSTATGRGAISYALGATSAGESRDSVNIMPFTCQSF